MEFEYSPRHPAGPALHLLSPSHGHAPAIEGFPGIRQLRRTLSRSPSKASKFSLYTTRSGSSSPTTPISPSALARAYSADPSIDLGAKSKYSIKRTGPPRSSVRKTSPKSPLRRALSDNTNQANVSANAMSLRRTSLDNEQENADRKDDGRRPSQEMRFDEPIKFDFTKARTEKLLHPPRHDSQTQAKSSPLKRSDGVMNLEAASFGSPRAKRRSLHGPSSLGNDFNVFDQSGEQANADIMDTSDEKYKHRDSGISFASSTWPAPSGRSPCTRPLNLRKSTMQQRAGQGRSRLFQDNSAEGTATSASLTRARSRISLDSALPMRSMDFESPFRRSDSNEPPVLFPMPAQRQYQSAPKPHPLSHALTPSSSASSMDRDRLPPAPTANEMVFIKPEIPKPHPTFSKSLPIGAIRPRSTAAQGVPGCSQQSFATPNGFKMAQPNPQAFMSTGLISKRNRNMDEPSENSMFGSSVNMPDTPSKRAHVMINSTPAPASGLGKVWHPTHEFGSPTSPFNGRISRVSPGGFGKGVNIFGSHTRACQLTRRGSIASVNGDEDTTSPTQRLQHQSSNDDLPPTPTKSTSTTARPQSKGKSNSLRSSLFGRRTSLGPDTFAVPASSDEAAAQAPEKSKCDLPVKTPGKRVEKDRRMVVDDSPMPSITLTTCIYATPSLFHSESSRQSRLARSSSPAASKESKSLSYFNVDERAHTETSVTAAACPADVGERRNSPHTPHESFTPPDPSGLSISAEHHAPVGFNSSISSFPPATPTGPRDSTFGVSKGQSQASSGYFANDVDTALTSRFGYISAIGIGEFSQVYRVEKPITEQSAAASFSKPSPANNVWAVKKTRRPYTGNKDRQRKMREVHILKGLRGHEHIVELFDEWESKNHLYIQTEFCEDGNLKDFLAQTGNKGRLDDFRIWKILLELSLGVKSIHDSSFIHLDLKPANVFIDWEGVLKIGDFGMASTWPAPPGLDGEGDREYIGPEVLSGRFDKPADLFALGMIMLEIAGNIVLPDNGMSWQRLRAGDLSDLPSLTFSSDNSLVRNESGDPVDMLNAASHDTICASNAESTDEDLSFLRTPVPRFDRHQDLVQPPNFMVDPSDPEALDSMVQWMLCPDPDQRPVIDQLLVAGGVQWVQRRRRAGATIYEGAWGPADDVLSHDNDVEMSDF